MARWTQQRDQAAFSALMARHGPMVLGVCRRLLGDLPEAEDAFQATFVVLSRQASRLRQPESLAGFLHTVAVRVARKARAAKHRRQRLLTNCEIPEPIDPKPHPLDVLSGRELLALMDEEIARLPQRNRIPVVLCLLQGRTIEEAARQLGWSVGSLRGRLVRGRERLRQRLARRGFDLSVGAVALLARVVVPEKLLAESLRHLSDSAPASISALADATFPTWNAKMIGLSLMVVTAIGLGAGFSLRPVPQPQTPMPTAPTTPQPQARNESRLDRFGDPLPPGAIARLGTLRFRAPGEIQMQTFAPDNKTLLVSSRGGLFLYDAFSGKRLRQIPSSSPAWRPDELLAFSSDGKKLIGRGDKITGSSAVRVVRVWELASGRQTQEYEIGQCVLWVGWASEGQPQALRIEENGTLHLHELHAGRSRSFTCAKPHKNPAGNISWDPPFSYSPRGHTLAVADEEGTVHIWNTDTGRERCTLQPNGNEITSLTFSPEGGRLMIRTAKNLQMWDAREGKVEYTVQSKNVIYGPLVFSADGKRLAIIKSWDTICIWDAATGKELGRTQEKDDFSTSFALSDDGKWLATSSRHGGSMFHLWDMDSGKKKSAPVGHLSQPHGTAFTPDGHRVATGGGLDGTIYFWNMDSGESLARIQRPGRWVRNIALSRDGRSLFSTWTDDELWISDAVSGGKRHILKLEDLDQPNTYQSAISMHQSSDGKTLVALSYYYERKTNRMKNATLITGWDTSTRKQLFRRRRPGMDSWIAVSPDARILAVPHPSGPRGIDPVPAKGPMRLEDVETGELLLTFPPQEGQTWPLEFSPDGRLLAANHFNNQRRGKDGQIIEVVQLWETSTTTEVLSFPGVDNNRVAFSADDRLLAVTEKAKEILVYDLVRQHEHQRFKGFDANVTWFAFSPDGRRLISGLSDSTLLVWEVKAPSPPRKLSDEAAAKAWEDLSGKDARRAFQARGTLASSPDTAIQLLNARLHPAQAADSQRLRRLLTDLESEQFSVRDNAQREFETLGDLAESALRQTLTNKPTLEVRRRVQAVLERLRGPVTRPELLQALRAVAVLEDIGTPAARRLLEELAKGAPEARLTREAKASLQRLDRREANGTYK